MEIKSNFSKLNNLIKLFRSKKVARVGVLAKSPKRDDANDNATIGALQEFGSISQNIPPRSFLKMPVSLKLKKIAQNGLKDSKKNLAEGKKDNVLKQIGIAAESVIQEAFDTSGFGQWASNSPVTIALKGSDKPLIDTSQLRKSIISDVVDK